MTEEGGEKKLKSCVFVWDRRAERGVCGGLEAKAGLAVEWRADREGPWKTPLVIRVCKHCQAAEKLLKNTSDIKTLPVDTSYYPRAPPTPPVH